MNNVTQTKRNKTIVICSNPEDRSMWSQRDVWAAVMTSKEDAWKYAGYSYDCVIFDGEINNDVKNLMRASLRSITKTPCWHQI